MVTKNGNKIDIKRLRSMYSASSINKTAFDSFAAREKNSAETKVERMLYLLSQAGLAEVGRKDVVDLFRELQEANCGEFLIGRRGHFSRFAWGVSLIDVGQVAAGEAETVEVLSEAEKQNVEAEEAQTADIEHAFNLRPDSRVVLRLPKNFTGAEAMRLADFIKTLPFSA